MMEKVLEEKKIKPGSRKNPEVKQKPIARPTILVDPQLEAIQTLTKLNGNLVEQVKDLSMEIDNLKDRVTQVATRLGL